MDSRIGSTRPMPMNAMTAAKAVIHTCFGCPCTASNRRGSALIVVVLRRSPHQEKLLTDANNLAGHGQCASAVVYATRGGWAAGTGASWGGKGRHRGRRGSAAPRVAAVPR